MEVYVNEKDSHIASSTANLFANFEVKNRIYYNILGSELVTKYLDSEGIDIKGLNNLHSIKKIIEEFDISDIMLKNIHIDVRVIFDENQIFIPKSHFTYNLTPDIYIALKISKDLSNGEILGFFEPKIINKNNTNGDYYFLEKEKLNSPFDLVSFVKNYDGNTRQQISQEDLEDFAGDIISFSDNDISDIDKKRLFEQLVKCDELRSKFIEYENFEILSYKAMRDSSIIKKEIADITEDFIEDEIIDENFDLEEISVQDELSDDDLIEEIGQTEIAEDVSEEAELAEEPIEDVLEETELVEETELTEDSLIEDSILEEVIEDEVFDETVEPNIDVEDGLLAVSDDLPEEMTELDALITDGIEPLNIDEDINITDEAIHDDISLNLKSEDILEEADLIETEIDKSENVESLVETSVLEEVNDDIEQAEIDEIEDNLISVEGFQLDDEIDLQEPSDEVISAEVLADKAADETQDVIQNDDLEKLEGMSAFGSSLLESLQADDSVELEESGFTSEVNVSEIVVESNSGNILDEIFQEQEDMSAETEEEQIDNIDDIPDISTVISEIIPEDVEENAFNGEELGILYNDEVNQTSTEQNISDDALIRRENSNKKSLFISILLVVFLASGIFYFIKSKNSNVTEIPQSASNRETADDNILTANVPTQPQVPQKAVEDMKNEIKKDIQNTSEPKVVIPVNNAHQAFMSVSKMTWDVPEAMVYNKDLQSYLKSAGKSIKLSLSADLLLASEYAYTNSVKMSLTIDRNGNLTANKMISGSGSAQIDNIVLQSVKDYINAVKPPVQGLQGNSFNLNLIIYF